MLVATFGPTTAWVGKQITHEADVFVLESHGPISAADIMEYDRQGHLVWVNDGTRAWVGSKATRSDASSSAAAASTVTPGRSEAREATTDLGSQPSSRRTTNLKRALVAAIIVLIAANVVLVLTMADVLHIP